MAARHLDMFLQFMFVRAVSNFDGNFLLHRRRYTKAALKNAGIKLMWTGHKQHTLTSGRSLVLALHKVGSCTRLGLIIVLYKSHLHLLTIH